MSLPPESSHLVKCWTGDLVGIVELHRGPLLHWQSFLITKVHSCIPMEPHSHPYILLVKTHLHSRNNITSTGSSSPWRMVSGCDPWKADAHQSMARPCWMLAGVASSCCVGMLTYRPALACYIWDVSTRSLSWGFLTFLKRRAGCEICSKDVLECTGYYQVSILCQ